MTVVTDLPATRATAPLRPLLVTSAAATAFAMIYAVAATEPGGLTAAFVSYAPVVSLVMWMRADARSRRVSLVFDWGLFALMTWPVLAPWYVFSTRGKAGWPLLGKLGLALVAPWIGAFIAFTVAAILGG